jgi:hypothetical protein
MLETLVLSRDHERLNISYFGIRLLARGGVADKPSQPIGSIASQRGRHCNFEPVFKKSQAFGRTLKGIQ